MARQSPDDIQKEVEEQEEEVYGTGTAGSSDPDPDIVTRDDSEEKLEDAVGNEIDNTKPFSLADEVEKDEKARRSKPIEPETEMEKVEKKEK